MGESERESRASQRESQRESRRVAAERESQRERKRDRNRAVCKSTTKVTGTHLIPIGERPSNQSSAARNQIHLRERACALAKKIFRNQAWESSFFSRNGLSMVAIGRAQAVQSILLELQQIIEQIKNRES